MSKRSSFHWVKTKDGALFLEGDSAAIVKSPAFEEKNPIGAGGAMVAGLVYQLVMGDALAEAVRWGIACGAAAASQSGTAMASDTLSAARKGCQA